MNDESATSAIDEITRLVTRYAEGFAGDPLATIEFYALPMIYVGPDAVSVIGTREEAAAFVEGILERPNAKQVQFDFFYDYRTNVALYPKWQAFLKERQPKTIIFWGQTDIFFTKEGGEAFLEVLPNAEMHRLDSGHFAVEDSLDVIASKMKTFYRNLN